MARGFTGGGGVPLNCWVALVGIAAAVALPWLLGGAGEAPPTTPPAAVNSASPTPPGSAEEAP